MIEQWVMDIYNKGQNQTQYRARKYNRPECYGGDFVVNIYNADDEGDFINVKLYEFLYNPKYGFAKAFWGDCNKEKCKDCSFCDDGIWIYRLYEYHLQQMVISEDPLKYLEQFKDKQ